MGSVVSNASGLSSGRSVGAADRCQRQRPDRSQRATHGSRESHAAGLARHPRRVTVAVFVSDSGRSRACPPATATSPSPGGNDRSRAQCHRVADESAGDPPPGASHTRTAPPACGGTSILSAHETIERAWTPGARTANGPKHRRTPARCECPSSFRPVLRIVSPTAPRISAGYRT
jgi:hypothetical protein